MGCKLHFKYVLSFILIFLMIQCKDIPRDNVLDPKNPDSISQHIIMIEAFVNTNNPLSVNAYALHALDSLSVLYGDRICIAEYHRNTTAYDDPYHLDKNELLYQHYVSQFDDVKGVPDIFINGSNQRIQGASSTSYSLFRLEAALADEILQNSYFLIDVDYIKDNNQIHPSVHLARLGREDARNIVVKALIVSHVSAPLHKRVVRAVTESQEIYRLAHGEHVEIILSEMPIHSDSINTLIIYVTDINATTIYQCASCIIK